MILRYVGGIVQKQVLVRYGIWRRNIIFAKRVVELSVYHFDLWNNGFWDSNDIVLHNPSEVLSVSTNSIRDAVKTLNLLKI